MDNYIEFLKSEYPILLRKFCSVTEKLFRFANEDSTILYSDARMEKLLKELDYLDAFSLPGEAAFKSELLKLVSKIAYLDLNVSCREVEFINAIFSTDFTVQNIIEFAGFTDDDLISSKISPEKILNVDLINGISGIIWTAVEFDNLDGTVSTDVDTSLAYEIYKFYHILFILFTAIDFIDEDAVTDSVISFLNMQAKYINENDNKIKDELKLCQTLQGLGNITEMLLKSRLFMKQSNMRKEPALGTISLEDSIFNELNSLVGLKTVKCDVSDLISFVKVQNERASKGFVRVPVSLHLAFTGNPGTGKTTVARLIAQLYKAIGILKTGQLIEVSRSDLVAGYVGQTALKTQAKISEALGGVLFIDEAYTLVKEGNDFGQEAIETLLKAMEDYRDEFVVIVAGYDELMDRFINSNPGLHSRFPKTIKFEDYTADQLAEIFANMCEKYGYIMTPEAEQMIEYSISVMVRNKSENFANARDVRNLFEQVVTLQAKRVAKINSHSDIIISTITAEDVPIRENTGKANSYDDEMPF